VWLGPSLILSPASSVPSHRTVFLLSWEAFQITKVSHPCDFLSSGVGATEGVMTLVAQVLWLTANNKGQPVPWQVGAIVFVPVRTSAWTPWYLELALSLVRHFHKNDTRLVNTLAKELWTSHLTCLHGKHEYALIKMGQIEGKVGVNYLETFLGLLSLLCDFHQCFDGNSRHTWLIPVLKPDKEVWRTAEPILFQL
jgi:hypothetical protein